MKTEIENKIQKLQEELNTIDHNRKFYSNPSMFEFLSSSTKEEIASLKRELFFLENPELNDLEF